MRISSGVSTRAKAATAAVFGIVVPVLTSATVIPTALAADCSDVDVVFARGTSEPAGIGRVGQALVDSLAPQLGNRTVSAYGVNYPATYDFLAAADGATDATNHIVSVAAQCPSTRFVLGGYSQGAAIVDVITSVPFPAIGFNNPLPPDAPDHIAALAVFGNPTARVGLPLTSSPVYGFKAIDLCNAGDPVCSDGNNVPAHRSYGADGAANQAAAFVANLL